MKKVKHKRTVEPAAVIEPLMPEWLVLDEYKIDGEQMLLICLPATGEVRCGWKSDFDDAEEA